MNRRDFIKISVVAGMANFLPAPLNPFTNIIMAAEKTDLAVAHGTPPSGITRAAVNALGGMKRFISRGDIVVVKPNIGWDRKPEFAATTNPEVVSAVILMCYEAGAKKVKVFDYTVIDPRRCYKSSGISDAASAAGGIVEYVDDKKFINTKLHGLALKSWPMYKDALEADKLINIPIAKHHGLTRLTLGMKNLMGLMGGQRGRIHQDINDSLVDVAMLVKPSLVILDAVRVLTDNGPQGGNLADVKQLNTVVAGTDQVAVDAYGATLFGLKGKDIGSVVAGHKAGLGTMDLTGLKIKKLNV